jgi:hypothetical protein
MQSLARSNGQKLGCNDAGGVMNNRGNVWRMARRTTRPREVVPEEEAAGEDWLGFAPDGMQGDLLRRVLNCTRQWGKSTITAAKAVARAQERAGSLTLVVSPSARQSGEFLRKAAAFVRRMGIRPRGDGDNEISLLFPNESRLVGLPGTEATVRGFSAVSLMLIDEAARVSDEMYRAVRPMLAVGDGDLWLMSTPFGKRGFFWEEWTNGGAQWERVAAPATECPRIAASFLAEERRSLGDRWFRQEYLCEFLEADDALFSREMVERAITDEVKPLF